MTSTPITTELRDAFVSVHAGTETSAAWLTFDGETFYNLCDAIDSIHANLERENTSLKAELDRLMGDQECERPTPTDGITDELRKEARGFGCFIYTSEQAKHLTAIADRIDAEHERILHETGEDVVRDVKREWVRLPVDADGEPIYVGDVLTDGEYTFYVCELAAFGDGSWSIRNEDGNAWAACDVTHYHIPTVEDVLRKFVHAILNQKPEFREKNIAEYAAKLRLAGDAHE